MQNGNITVGCAEHHRVSHDFVYICHLSHKEVQVDDATRVLYHEIQMNYANSDSRKQVKNSTNEQMFKIKSEKLHEICMEVI